MVSELPWSGKNWGKMAVFSQAHGILYQIREIQTSTCESVKSQGISFLSIHKVSLLVKVMSFIFKNYIYEGVDFCHFIAGFNAEGFVIGKVSRNQFVVNK